MSDSHQDIPSKAFSRGRYHDLPSAPKQPRVVTRYDSLGTRYLHLGDARSICLNFDLAQAHNGCFSLRFDDPLPVNDVNKYEESIIEDVRWLAGNDRELRISHVSDYFDQLYAFARELVEKGLAFVCSLSLEEIRNRRGTITEPGRASPYRNRSIQENLDLLGQMKSGRLPVDSHVLRAKIDMAAKDPMLRDPVIYTILHTPHPRTGTQWSIYPTFAFAECFCDAIEGITHIFYEQNFGGFLQGLQDWLLEKSAQVTQLKRIPYEYLELSHTVLNTHRLNRLIQAGAVRGWDDPRMPTLSGLRRRGFPAEAIRNFFERTGDLFSNAQVDIGLLEHAVRVALHQRTPRFMAVLDPIRLVIVNYPDDQEEFFQVCNHPEDKDMGQRTIPFSRELYIEAEDFREDPPHKFFRLAPGRELRLRHAYCVTCVDFKKNEHGQVTEVHGTYDPQTRGGDAPDGRKVKGILDWVSARHCRRAEVRLYERLFMHPRPTTMEGRDIDFIKQLNPNSLQSRTDCKVEPALAGIAPGFQVQFAKKGFFCPDPNSSEHTPIFNRIVPLRDSWAKA